MSTRRVAYSWIGHDGRPDPAGLDAYRYVIIKLPYDLADRFIGSDATAHMAEETRNAGLVIPRAMWWSYVVNGFMVFLMLITYCFQTGV